MTLQEFYDNELDQDLGCIYLVRVKENTPFGEAYFNVIVYVDSETYEPVTISEQELGEPHTYQVEGTLDIQEINLATMVIVANGIRRRRGLL